MQSNSILHSYSWPPTHGSCIKMSDQQTACNDHLQSDWHFTKTQIIKTLFSCLAIPPLPPSTPPSPRQLLNVPWHNFNSIHITHPWYWIGIRANGITDSDSDTVFSKQTETEKWWKGIRQAINTTKQKNGRYRSINVDKHKTSQGHQPCALQANGWCRRLFPIFGQTAGHPSCGPSDCPHLSGTSHTQLNTLVRCTKHCWRHCPGSQPRFSPLPSLNSLTSADNAHWSTGQRQTQ